MDLAPSSHDHWLTCLLVFLYKVLINYCRFILEYAKFNLYSRLSRMMRAAPISLITVNKDITMRF
jgi:hypothetical protein